MFSIIERTRVSKREFRCEPAAEMEMFQSKPVFLTEVQLVVIEKRVNRAVVFEKCYPRVIKNGVKN